MQISSQAVARTCAICDRCLLMGERAVRYAPQGGEFVDVCPLCQEIAVEYGWVKEGSADDADVSRLSGASAATGCRTIFERAVRPRDRRTVASEPILRRLCQPELAMVEAADLFNASDFRRTIGGVAKSLGEPRASILPLSGVNPEVVDHVAWDISWYQYRVASDSAQPVRLEERGHELGELDRELFRTWNARVEDGGPRRAGIARI